jgi:hypothetical protein
MQRMAAAGNGLAGFSWEVDRMSGFRRYLFFACCSLVIPGCFHGPGGAGYGYMGQPGVYPQQMYAPSGGFNAPGSYAAPGTFITPPSNAPPYSPGGSAPGSTYEKDPVPSNPGQNNGVSPFYEDKKEDPVPKPRDPSGGGSIFQDDLDRPGT